MAARQGHSVSDALRVLDQRAEGAEAGFVLEHIDPILDAEVERIHQSVFGEIEKPGEALDPLVAVQAWLELHAIRKLRARLRQRSKKAATREPSS